MNKIECSRPNISEYEFLKLYSATIISQGKNPIFENHKLEKELYKYYSKEEYNFLFEDFTIRKNEIHKENSYVDLNTSLMQCYTFGILIQLQTNNLKSFINLSKENAKEIFLSFNEKQIEAMRNLCNELDKESNKIYTKKSI